MGVVMRRTADRALIVPAWPAVVSVGEGGRPMDGRVTAVNRRAGHTFSKANHGCIRLLAGLGVEGDAHLGTTVQHRSRAARDPSQPNLRQAHLIHAELHDELRAAGFAVVAGQMGENITTRGVDLLGLPIGARLCLGDAASGGGDRPPQPLRPPRPGPTGPNGGDAGA